MTTDAADTQLSCSESRGSPELIRTISKTEVVKQDVRRLKSVTLDRMGKMFKSRTLVVGRSSLDTVSDLDPRSAIFHKCKGSPERTSRLASSNLMIYEGNLNLESVGIVKMNYTIMF